MTTNTTTTTTTLAASMITPTTPPPAVPTTPTLTPPSPTTMITPTTPPPTTTNLPSSTPTHGNNYTSHAFVISDLVKDEGERSGRIFETALRTSKIQKNLTEILVDRINLGLSTMIRMIHYMTARAKIAKTMSQELRELPKLHGTGETGTLEMSFDYLVRVSSTESVTSLQLSDFITQQTLPALQKQLSDSRAQFNTVKQQSTQIISSLDATVAHAKAAFTTYSNSLQAAQKLGGESDSPILSDPVLPRLEYYQAVAHLEEIQMNLNQELKNMYREVSRIDLTRIDMIKLLTKEYITESAKHVSKIAKDIDIAGKVLDGVDSRSDWLSFCKQKNLSKEEHRNQHHYGPETNFEDILPSSFLCDEDKTTIKNPYKHQDIVKIGKMELSGMFRWSEYTFVISNFGFLHRFPNPEGVPDESIPLGLCEVQMNEKSSNSFQLLYNSGGYFSQTKTYVLRTTNSETLVEWVMSIKKFLQEKKK